MVNYAINKGPVEPCETLEQLKLLLGDSLQLGVQCVNFRANTLLLGNLPELDSMAVITVITALEEYFHFVVEDEDDLAAAFVSLGSLTQYVTDKSQKNESYSV